MNPQFAMRANWWQPQTAFFLFATVLWLLASPYGGISHDAVLYAADAARHQYPDGLGQDLFFGQNTQGDYSLFGRPYAWLIGVLGIDQAAYTLTLCGRLGWFVAVLALCRSLWSSPAALVAAAVMLIGPRFYDGSRIFAFAEAFATPRLWAEALGLLALAAACRARWVWALGAGLLSVAFHPLMGLPILLVLVLMQPKGLRNTALLVLPALGLLAGALGWPLFERLYQRYDPEWWAAVRIWNPYVLPEFWFPSALVTQAVLVTWLAATAVLLRPQSAALARLAGAAAGMGAIMTAAWVLGSLTQNVLLIQLQLWRGHWLTLLLAPALWAATILGVESKRGLRLLHLGLALQAFAHESTLGVSVALLSPALLLWPSARAWLQNRETTAGRLGWALLIIALGTRALHALLLVQTAEADVTIAGKVALVAAVPIIAFAVLALGYRLLAFQGKALWTTSALLSVAALWVAVFNWGHVPDLVDGRAADFQQGIDALLPANAVIASDMGASLTWFALHRAHYASRQQIAGALFSRTSTLELERRLSRLRANGFSDGNTPRNESAHTSVPITENSVRTLCEDPALDAVLLKSARPNADRLIPNPAKTGQVSVYLCRQHPEALQKP
ncbi:hypothetical protein [Ideonella sp.]|uniref:hypothetical protein n=1 Tax=Ideonella sp. TaxID=1929293 RepID=UPI003BB51679